MPPCSYQTYHLHCVSPARMKRLNGAGVVTASPELKNSPRSAMPAAILVSALRMFSGNPFSDSTSCDGCFSVQPALLGACCGFGAGLDGVASVHAALSVSAAAKARMRSPRMQGPIQDLVRIGAHIGVPVALVLARREQRPLRFGLEHDNRLEVGDAALLIPDNPLATGMRGTDEAAAGGVLLRRDDIGRIEGATALRHAATMVDSLRAL